MSDPVSPAVPQQEPASLAQPPSGAPAFPESSVQQVHPQAAGSATPVRRLRGIGAATRWMVLVYAALSLGELLMHAWGIATLNAYRAGSGGIDALEAYDSVSARVSIVSLIVLATSGICWLVWQYRAAASVPAGALRRSPGWQVGSWFIPVVSLWFPFQNISDLAAGARAALGRGVRAGWWALWIAGGVTSGIGGRALITADTLDSLVSALTILILSEALVIASAAFAWIVVARITDAVDPAVH